MGTPVNLPYLPKSARAYFFPNLSKFITVAAAPLVLTPFVRNQFRRSFSEKFLQTPPCSGTSVVSSPEGQGQILSGHPFLLGLFICLFSTHARSFPLRCGFGHADRPGSPPRDIFILGRDAGSRATCFRSMRGITAFISAAFSHVAIIIIIIIIIIIVIITNNVIIITVSLLWLLLLLLYHYLVVIIIMIIIINDNNNNNNNIIIIIIIIIIIMCFSYCCHYYYYYYYYYYSSSSSSYYYYYYHQSLTLLSTTLGGRCALKQTPLPLDSSAAALVSIYGIL